MFTKGPRKGMKCRRIRVKGHGMRWVCSKKKRR